MTSEILKLTAQIVTSHASMSELTPKELIEEIKEVYTLLTSLEGGVVLPEEVEAAAPAAEEMVKKPPIPPGDIVQDKFVVCLECGQRLRTLKAHLRKAHQLSPKDYYRRYGLDPKKFPLVCREYSEQRRKLAKAKGLGVKKPA
jgi:predicted transcriptional regulator